MARKDKILFMESLIRKFPLNQKLLLIALQVSKEQLYLEQILKLTRLVYEPEELFRLFVAVLSYFLKSDIQESFSQIMALEDSTVRFDRSFVLRILKQFLDDGDIEKFIFYAKLSGVDDEKIFNVLEQTKIKFVSQMTAKEQAVYQKILASGM